MLSDLNFKITFLNLQLDARGLMVKLPQFHIGNKYDPSLLGSWRYSGEEGQINIPRAAESESIKRRDAFLLDAILCMGITIGLVGLFGALLGFLSIFTKNAILNVVS